MKKSSKAPTASAEYFPDIDAFNEAQHRGQRRLRLAIQILNHPGENFMGESPLEDDEFVSALAELLENAAEDLTKADAVMQYAYKRRRGAA